MNNEPMTNLIIRIPERLKMMLQSCADEQDLTASQIVRGLIRDYCKANYIGDLFVEQTKKKERKK